MYSPLTLVLASTSSSCGLSSVMPEVNTVPHTEYTRAPEFCVTYSDTSAIDMCGGANWTLCNTWTVHSIFLLIYFSEHVASLACLWCRLWTAHAQSRIDISLLKHELMAAISHLLLWRFCVPNVTPLSSLFSTQLIPSRLASIYFDTAVSVQVTWSLLRRNVMLTLLAWHIHIHTTKKTHTIMPKVRRQVPTLQRAGASCTIILWMDTTLIKQKHSSW